MNEQQSLEEDVALTTLADIQDDVSPAAEQTVLNVDTAMQDADVSSEDILQSSVDEEVVIPEEVVSDIMDSSHDD
jgi:hypothetical protein